jgi:hypothetical protein
MNYRRVSPLLNAKASVSALTPCNDVVTPNRNVKIPSDSSERCSMP